MSIYKIKCVKGQTSFDPDCGGSIKDYQYGLLFTKGKTVTLIRQGYTYHVKNGRFFLEDPFGTKLDLSPNETLYNYNQLLEVLSSCRCCVGDGNVDNVTDIYDSSPKVKHIITLSQVEYNAIVTPDPFTYYIVL